MRTKARVAAWVWSLCGCVLACSGSSNRQPSAIAVEAVALNNRAVGLMGQFEYGQAREIFDRLSTEYPDRLDLQVNVAIATLHRQADGDVPSAQRILEHVVAADAGNLRAQYNLGLLLLHEGRAPEALPHFTIVAGSDPRNAFAHYFVGQCRFQQSDFAGALTAYERAFTINPRLRSAAYGAFQTRQRLGRADAQQMLDTFRALERNPQSEVAEFKYTRLGPLADAATIDQQAVPDAPRPAGAVFESAVMPVEPLPAGMTWRRIGDGRPRDDALPMSITAADIDGDGRIDLFIAGAIDDHGTTRNAVLLHRGDARFTIDASHPLASVSDVRAALWGDVDNDGRVDVYFCRQGANQLWRQTAAGKWSMDSPGANAGGGGGVTIDGALFDADHDGDLDVLLIKENGASELLNNNGDGTFRALGSIIGLAATNRTARGAVIADLDADRDADILAIRKTPPHDVHLNDRAWQYHADPAFDAIARAPIAAAVAADFDADGQPEIYTSDPEGIRRWQRPAASSSWESRIIGGTERLANASQLAVADVDGDGHVDLMGTTTDGQWAAVAIAKGEVASPLFMPSGPTIAGWAIVVLEAEHGPAVVAMPADSSAGPLLWRPGPGRFRFVTTSLTGRDPRSRQIRSNTSGIGTKLVARTGSRWTALDTYRPQSGTGQSQQPVAIGTGGAPQIDFVALTWSDGVFQSEVGLAPGPVLTIAETQRQLSSCPVLFAFDGTHFAFVTDLLGVGGIGTPTRPGVYATPRPRENVLLPEGTLAVRDEQYRLKISEPMEEVAYIDAARLVTYDLPPGWQMVLDERQATTAPDATGDPRFYREERLPIQVTTFDGIHDEDVTRALATADGVAASVGRVDPRHIGRTDEHMLVLKFDRPIDGRIGTAPMLVADGWVEYPYAQTLFAAWQARASYQAPTIEARGADGRWHLVRERFGYPAGMPRRMSVPLGQLPAGTRELRLRTTQEIYWDRLAVAYAEPCPMAATHTLPLASALVARTGFARRATSEIRRPSYDYEHRAPLWDVRYPRGFYTAEGVATELLAREDGALAILGPGEELDLEFRAAEPILRPGWTRRFVLEARGWCKDMDLYTKDGDTVDPVPGVRSPEAEQLQRRYTTRYESGR